MIFLLLSKKQYLNNNRKNKFCNKELSESDNELVEQKPTILIFQKDIAVCNTEITLWNLRVVGYFRQSKMVCNTLCSYLFILSSRKTENEYFGMLMKLEKKIESTK